MHASTAAANRDGQAERAGGGDGPGQYQRRHGRYRQADLIHEYVDDHDEQSVLRDQPDEILGHARLRTLRCSMSGKSAAAAPSKGRIGAQPIHELDALAVGQHAEHGGTDAAQAESEAEEQPRHGAHAARHDLLREHEDGRERRGQDESDDHA